MLGSARLGQAGWQGREAGFAAVANNAFGHRPALGIQVADGGIDLLARGGQQFRRAIAEVGFGQVGMALVTGLVTQRSMQIWKQKI